MIRILPDHDVIGSTDLIIRYCDEHWPEFVAGLDLEIARFADFGLVIEAKDIDVWKVCQEIHLCPVTGNRNQDDPDSLEDAIRQFNRAESLPVLTIGRPQSLQSDHEYLGRTAVSFLRD